MNEKTGVVGIFSSDWLGGLVLSEEETLKFKSESIVRCFSHSIDGTITVWKHKDGRILIDSIEPPNTD